MKIKALVVAAFNIAAFAVGVAPCGALHPHPAATATAKKGPIRLTLRLYKTSVKHEKSLWYQIELKNIGKKKILVTDKIFRDPWAMHQNIMNRYGIYLDVASADKRYSDVIIPYRKREGDGLYSAPLRDGVGEQGGAGQIHYDYGDKGVPPEEGKAVNDELAKEEAEWTRQGLSDAQKTINRFNFWRDWNRKKMDEEDRAKEFWLASGASTATFAWAYRNPDPSLENSKDEDGIGGKERQVGDYTQLWDYLLFFPGKYLVRAVYEHSVSDESRRTREKYRIDSDPWDVIVKTPPIEIQVQP